MEIRYMAQLDDRLAISKVYEERWKYGNMEICVSRHYNAGLP